MKTRSKPEKVIRIRVVMSEADYAEARLYYTSAEIRSVLEEEGVINLMNNVAGYRSQMRHEEAERR